MINRKSLVIAIPLLLSASHSVHAVDIFNKNGNKLEIYGSINPNHEFSHKFLSKQIESHNDNTNAILGLSGEINITDELISYGTIEYRTDFFSPEDTIDKKQSNTVRLGYAGFKYGNLGSIDYGRNYGVFHDVESLTNHIPYIFNKNSIFSNNDSYMIGRNNSLLTYRNKNFFGLFDGISFALQYQNQAKNQLSKQEYNSSWGASVKYETDVGLTAIGSCFSTEGYKYNEQHKIEKISPINAYGLGFKYDANDVYIAAFYGAGSNLKLSNINANHEPNIDMNKTENIEAIAEYNFHSGFYPSLSYVDSKVQNSNAKNSSNQNTWELAKQINISTRYEFNKNISTYMNYKINLLKNTNEFIEKNNIPTDNVIGAGLVYQF